jgi:hypothetical protein
MGTPLPPNDHKIDLPKAAQLTRVFRERGKGTTAPVIAFNREGFERILAQPDAVGIRIYPAVRDDGTMTYVLVGVDKAGNDMVDGELSEEGVECPIYCPDPNVLNGGQ